MRFVKLSEKTTYEDKELQHRHNKLKYVFLELTSRCNMNCKHCGSDCNGDIGKEELTTQQWCEFINKLAQAYNDFRVKIHITGGEPLLRKDFAEIAFALHESGFEWGITTNGLLLNDDLRIEVLHSMGMKTISLSIDGVAETHDALRGIPGAFELTMLTLKKLISFGKYKSVQVTTAVNKKNITELPDLYDMFRGIGLRDWRIASVDPIGRAENATDLLLDVGDYEKLFAFITRIRRENSLNIQYGCSHYVPNSFKFDLRDMPYRCGAGEFIASVLSNGDIYSCVDIERRPELVQGNILRDDFVKVWLYGFKEFQREGRVKSSSKCSQCHHSEMCNGDSAHTWDYSKHEPRVCLYNEMRKHRYTSLGLCGKCGKELQKNDAYCTSCGTKRGDGDFIGHDTASSAHYPFDDNYFQALYAPPPPRYRYECPNCGTDWNRASQSREGVKYCPLCGSKLKATMVSWR